MLLLDKTTDGSTPPTGPGLTNGYPTELTCSMFDSTDLKLDQLVVWGVKNTNAGAFGLLCEKNVVEKPKILHSLVTIHYLVS